MRPATPASSLTRHHAVFWLALCLLVLKALVPQGFMLGTDPSTTLIQVCSASGSRWIQSPIAVEHDQHSPFKDTQHAEPSVVCPGIALAALPLFSPPGLTSPIAISPLRVVAARAPPWVANASTLGTPVGARAPPISIG